MTVRTVSDSVPDEVERNTDRDALEAHLVTLRRRFEGATFTRYRATVPVVHPTAWVAPTAVLMGEIRIGPEASVWPGCILRGDLRSIEVGARTNLQDGTVVHLGDLDPTVIGDDVVVGHRALLHGCTVHDACLIGMGAIVLDGAVIGEGSIVGAGSVVPAGKVIPPRSLVLGLPGRVVKELDASVATFHREVAAKYVRLMRQHRDG